MVDWDKKIQLGPPNLLLPPSHATKSTRVSIYIKKVQQLFYQTPSEGTSMIRSPLTVKPSLITCSQKRRMTLPASHMLLVNFLHEEIRRFIEKTKNNDFSDIKDFLFVIDWCIHSPFAPSLDLKVQDSSGYSSPLEKIFRILHNFLRPGSALTFESAAQSVTSILSKSTTRSTEVGLFGEICAKLAGQILYYHPSQIKLVRLIAYLKLSPQLSQIIQIKDSKKLVDPFHTSTYYTSKTTHKPLGCRYGLVCPTLAPRGTDKGKVDL